MDLFQALTLGLVEGITEFLPVSSTGHLILASKLLRLPESEFLKSFEIAIQLGAILSVVVLYGRRLLVDPRVLSRVAVAFVPAAVLGFAFYKLIRRFLLSNDTVVLWALLIGGIFLIVFEKRYRPKEGCCDRLESIPHSKAFWIGVCQALAIVPGVSRSAATILGGLSAGIERKTIVEFSFLLAVPTMMSATAYDLWKNAPAFGQDELGLLLAGALCSFTVALFSIRFLLRYVRTHSFVAFGVYRIVAALLFWAVLYRP